MANRKPSDAGQQSDNVKVAKISAVQAVMVALVAGAAGVVSTAGLRYVEHSNELARKDKEMEELRAKSQSAIDDLQDKLHQSSAASSLLVAATNLSQEQCYERMPAALKAAVPNADDYSASLRETPDTGSRAWLGGFKVRFLCNAAANLLIVTVAANGSVAETGRVAQVVLSALQK
jgi:hypothetical protein